MGGGEERKSGPVEMATAGHIMHTKALNVHGEW